MGQSAIELLELAGSWEECPARGQLTSDVDWHTLRPVDLGWPEHWVEAFLAEQHEAVSSCLGRPMPQATVWRQLADIDLVVMAADSDEAILVELKKQRGSHARDAVCQLARNVARAKQMLRSHGKTSLRAVVCGTWSAGQLARARDTVAWSYLQDEGVSPEFLLHSGARANNGRTFFVLGARSLPFQRKGKAIPDAGYSELRSFTDELARGLPEGLRVSLNRLPHGVIVRFTAESKIRDTYLRSKSGSRHTGSLGAFLRVHTGLNKRGLEVRPTIGQRLELRLEVRCEQGGTSNDYSEVRSLLTNIADLCKQRVD